MVNIVAVVKLRSSLVLPGVALRSSEMEQRDLTLLPLLLFGASHLLLSISAEFFLTALFYELLHLVS